MLHVPRQRPDGGHESSHDDATRPGDGLDLSSVWAGLQQPSRARPSPSCPRGQKLHVSRVRLKVLAEEQNQKTHEERP